MRGKYIGGHDGGGLEFNSLEIFVIGTFALLFPVIIRFLGDDRHITQCREVSRDNQRRGKRRLKSRLIKAGNDPAGIACLPSTHSFTEGSGVPRTESKTCTSFARCNRCIRSGKSRPWHYSRSHQRIRKEHSSHWYDGFFRRIQWLQFGHFRRR